jgi:hypothetical protein
MILKLLAQCGVGLGSDFLVWGYLESGLNVEFPH